MTLSALVFSSCGFFIGSRGARHARAHAHACARKYWLNWASLIEAVLFAPVARCRPRRPPTRLFQWRWINKWFPTKKHAVASPPTPVVCPTKLCHFVFPLSSARNPSLRTPSFFFSLFTYPLFFFCFLIVEFKIVSKTSNRTRIRVVELLFALFDKWSVFVETT